MRRVTLQNKLKVLTVCSGIGAPEVAMKPLGFKFVGQSEIEPFPSHILNHHFPDVPNFGDMTKFKDWNLNAANVDVLVGGTPCQSFSLSGLRKGLDSPNGNLALVFLSMVEYYAPSWVIWENVPGVLSSRSNGRSDFGTFLGALRKLGYSFCYRVLDSQYFGVPQRRRRVFVVGHISDWRCAGAVLFERESLSGDTAKSRKKREKNACPIAKGSPAASAENEQVETDGLSYNRMVSYGEYVESDCSSALLAHEAKDVSDIVTQPLYREKGHGDYTSSDVAGTLLAQQSKRAVDLVTWPAQIGNTLGADWGDKMGLNNQHIASGAPYFFPAQDRVRRLLPIEAERLQGFPDGWTDIPYKGKDAPDGPRYKALGNSMAVPVLRWITRRLLMTQEVIDE